MNRKNVLLSRYERRYNLLQSALDDLTRSSESTRKDREEERTEEGGGNNDAVKRQRELDARLELERRCLSLASRVSVAETEVNEVRDLLNVATDNIAELEEEVRVERDGRVRERVRRLRLSEERDVLRVEVEGLREVKENQIREYDTEVNILRTELDLEVARSDRIARIVGNGTVEEWEGVREELRVARRELEGERKDRLRWENRATVAISKLRDARVRISGLEGERDEALREVKVWR